MQPGQAVGNQIGGREFGGGYSSHFSFPDHTKPMENGSDRLSGWGAPKRLCNCLPPFMALPLSSAIIYHKLSLHVFIAPSVSKRVSLSTQFTVCSNQILSRDPARKGRSRIPCLSKRKFSKVGFHLVRLCLKHGLWASPLWEIVIDWNFSYI